MSRSAIVGISLIIILLAASIPAAATTAGYTGEVWTGYTPPASFVLRGGAYFPTANYLLACGGDWGSGPRVECAQSGGFSAFAAVSSLPEARAYPAYATYHNRLYILGGYTKPGASYYDKNQTYYSADEGATWTILNGSSGWLPRDMAAAVVYNDRLWMTGGTNATTGAMYNDTWFLDTANETAGVWTRAINQSPWSYRQGHSMMVLGGKMWVVGGSKNAGMTAPTGDAWWSTDGVVWTKAASDTALARTGAGLAVTNIDRIGDIAVLEGGADSGGMTVLSVYGSTDGATWFSVNTSGTVHFSASEPPYSGFVNWTPPASAPSNEFKGYEALYRFDNWNMQPYTYLTMPRPRADATPADSSGASPFAVGWTDATTGWATTYTWDFRDGYFSFERNASHVFTSTGTFPVLFTVSGFFGSASTTLNVSVGTPQSQVQYYTQKTVRLKVVDRSGIPMPGVNVSVSYLNATLPSTNTTWLISAFGISAEVANEMVNSGLAMQGWTGGDGSVTFVMFPALTYGVAVRNTTLGLSQYTTISPQDPDYVIHVTLPSQYPGNQTYMTLRNVSLWVTEPTYDTVQFHMVYYDPAALTTSLQYNITFWGNQTPLYYQTFHPGAEVVLDDNVTIPNVNGVEVRFWINATRSAPF